MTKSLTTDDGELLPLSASSAGLPKPGALDAYGILSRGVWPDGGVQVVSAGDGEVS